MTRDWLLIDLGLKTACTEKLRPQMLLRAVVLVRRERYRYLDDVDRQRMSIISNIEGQRLTEAKS